MLHAQVSSIVSGICESFGLSDQHTQIEYRNGQYKGNGLLFRFDIGVSCYAPDREYSSNRIELCILVCGHRVWIKKFPLGSRKSADEFLSPLNWENTSNHDSCWRSDGLDSPLSQVYFTLCSEVNSKREEAGESSIAPKGMDEYVHSPICGKMLNSVSLRWKKKAGDDNTGPRYGYDILEVEEAEPLSRVTERNTDVSH